MLLVGIDPYNHCLTGDKAATLGVNCGLGTGRNGVILVVDKNGENSGTLDASYYKGCGQRNGVEREVVAVPAERKWIVRRLTPTECARLQGMPDWWCKDVKHSDSAEYKMWGNGMALPTLMYAIEGIALALRKDRFKQIFKGKDNEV